jgi:acyl-CoA dehydrogenase
MQDLMMLRLEVQEFMAQNIPADLEVPRRGQAPSDATIKWAVEFRRKLGERGWIAPNWPTYFGGGGLPNQAANVIFEELGRRSLPQLPINQLWITPCRLYATEEQKAKWLTKTLRGEITVNQILTEPKSGGTDLSNQETTAIRNGDYFLVNGEKGYTSNPFPPDYLFVLVTTDPEGRKYENLSSILIDAHDPGVTVRKRDILTGATQRAFQFKDVRTPADQIIGGVGNGWTVAQAVLELERGTLGITRKQMDDVEARERAYWEGKG